MSEHFYHFVLSLLPVVILLVWLIRNTKRDLTRHIFLAAIVAVLISILSFPIHSWHLNQDNQFQNYDCCILYPTFVTAVFTLSLFVAPMIERVKQPEVYICVANTFLINYRAPPTV
jgi:uncharacterized membrane protein